mgnify:CR=1 FL=1
MNKMGLIFIFLVILLGKNVIAASNIANTFILNIGDNIVIPIATYEGSKPSIYILDKDFNLSRIEFPNDDSNFGYKKTAELIRAVVFSHCGACEKRFSAKSLNTIAKLANDHRRSFERRSCLNRKKGGLRFSCAVLYTENHRLTMKNAVIHHECGCLRLMR